VLITITAKGSSLEFFNPIQLLSTECLASLVDILNDPSVKARPTLAHKSMILLLNLGQYFKNSVQSFVFLTQCTIYAC